MRNPLYLGNILLWLGFALSARLLWLAPVVVVLLAFEYHAIVRWEETLLAMRLGDAYLRLHDRASPDGFLASAVRTRTPSRTPIPCRACFRGERRCYSERGTLIAIAAGYGLLALKAYQTGARVLAPGLGAEESEVGGSGIRG